MVQRVPIDDILRISDEQRRAKMEEDAKTCRLEQQISSTEVKGMLMSALLVVDLGDPHSTFGLLSTGQRPLI